jgi:hypothetical protein
LSVVPPPPPCTCGAQTEVGKLCKMLQDGDSKVYQQAARSLEALIQEIKDRRVDESIHKQVECRLFVR